MNIQSNERRTLRCADANFIYSNAQHTYDTYKHIALTPRK